MADTPQPVDPKRPDLEESTNVAETHAALLESGAAQAREKRLKENGLEPVSLWIFLASAVVLLVGGAVMGAGGGLFNYDPHLKGYVRGEFEGAGSEGPTDGPLLDAMMKRGLKVYQSKCNGCHGSSGEGSAGVAPPLAGSEWVTGNTEILSQIILNGLKGEIVVKGQSYNLAMPYQELEASQLAAVMTYVRNANSFGNSTGDVVTVDQAKTAIEISRERSGGAAIPPQITVEELKASHDKMLEGESLDPATKVNLETLEPVEPSAAE